MYEQYWGLTSTPFTNRISGHNYVESPIHEESLARLLYCIEQEKAFAILHGPNGCGKSQLLSVLSQQIRRTQRFLAPLELNGGTEAEFLHQLQQSLRLGGAESENPAAHWRRLRDFFLATQESGVQTVIVLEGLDRAENSLVFALTRLISLHNRSEARLTVVASLKPAQFSPALSELLKLADMGVEVRPLKREETAAYVQQRLQTSGGRREVFSPDAIEQLQQQTGGVPRELNRLCDLAMLAGMNDSRTAIDSELIAGLSGEHRLPVSSR